MTSHAAFRRLLAARHDLSPSEQRLLRAHLSQCASCRRLAGEYRRQDAFLRALPAIAPSAGFQREVLRRIAARPERAGRRWRALRLLSPGILATCLLLVTWIGGEPRPAVIGQFPASAAEQLPPPPLASVPYSYGPDIPASPAIPPMPPNSSLQRASAAVRIPPPPYALMVRVLRASRTGSTRSRPAQAHRSAHARPHGPRTRDH